MAGQDLGNFRDFVSKCPSHCNVSGSNVLWSSRIEVSGRIRLQTSVLDSGSIGSVVANHIRYSGICTKRTAWPKSFAIRHVSKQQPFCVDLESGKVVDMYSLLYQTVRQIWLEVVMGFLLSLLLRGDILLFARPTLSRNEPATSVITSKPAIREQVKTGQRRPSRTNFFYPAEGSVGKSVLVRQLRGPHFSTCPWWRRRSSMALTAAASPNNLPQSSTGRLEVTSVLARS